MHALILAGAAAVSALLGPADGGGKVFSLLRHLAMPTSPTSRSARRSSRTSALRDEDLLGEREAAERPAGLSPLPDRGRCGRADSRRRGYSGRGSATWSTCRTTRAGARRDSAGGPNSCSWRAGLPNRPGELRLVAPDAQIAFTPAVAETAARDPARIERGRRAAANHRHRPRLPRPGLAAGRERDPDLPADRRQPPDLAVRASPPGRAAALVGGAQRDRRRRGRAAGARTASSGTGSPARFRRACRRRRAARGRAPTRRARSRPTIGW